MTFTRSHSARLSASCVAVLATLFGSTNLLADDVDVATDVASDASIDNPFDTELAGGRSLSQMLNWFSPFDFGQTPAVETIDVGEPVDELLIDDEQIDNGRLSVTVNDSRIITTSRPYARVAIGREDVAEVQPLSPTELLVTAKLPGTTQFVLWDDNGKSQTMLLHSAADLRAAQAKLDELLPQSQIRLSDLGNKIGLVGRAKSVEEADRATMIVSTFGQPENLLDLPGGEQVSLRIRFAEVSRTAGKEFGVNFGFTDGTGTVAGSNIGQINPVSFFPDPDTGIISRTAIGLRDPNTGVQLFGLASIDGDPLGYYINALRESNLLRILADPELVVASGEQGDFLAGGEYPVPVPSEEGIAIEYREFGIRLVYTPVVLGDGRIRMKIISEVSDLDDTIALSIGGTRVPGLRTRNTATVVELRDGQSLAISGLLRSNAIASKSSVPLLGDIPILGALFRSTRYSRQETELVVLITPRLVAPLDPDQVPLLPGENWHHPNDVELFLAGQLGGVQGVDKPDDTDIDGADDRARSTVKPQLKTRYAFTPAAAID
jgi:pilus assembly protein CpaC